MKKLPKINAAQVLKASLPYVIIGLLCTKLGEAYRLTTGTDILDKVLGTFTRWVRSFKIRSPACTRLIFSWVRRRLCW